MCEEKIKKSEARLLILAEDLSKNTKEKFIKLAEVYHVKHEEFGTIMDLSNSIGKTNKGVLTILDEGFANKISQMVKNFKGANN